MNYLNEKLLLAAAMGLVLTGCGGGGTATPEAVGEEVATSVEQAADTTAAAVDNAAEGVMDAANNAGWTDLQANWQESISSVRDRWDELSDEDLLSVNGDRDALVSLLQDKYGFDRQTAESEVDAWASTL
ncbi:MAG: hypothetical protein HKN42_09625 [Granulosicoccus sp.]|nr:hypothetical protein [Granulosicoccus sp.]